MGLSTIDMKKLLNSISQSIRRSRIYISIIFLIYCISCSIGIIMSHQGNHFALSQYDKIVNKAIQSDKASLNYQKGNNFSAAIIDFGENLFFGAIPQTVLGLTIIPPYFTVANQGWVAGIVSVDRDHHSRFKNFKATFYYFFVLLLQFIPYSLSIGSGIKFGVDNYNFNKKINFSIRKYKFRRESFIDLGLIFILVVPLFFIASCFEFLSSWNI